MTILRLDDADLKKKSKDELIGEIYKREEEIERLRKKLRKYENPDTPSSAHPHLKPSVPLMPHGAHPKKRGAPFGHKGTTRPRGEADELRHIVARACPNCLSDDINVTGHRRQQQEEAPQEMKPKVVNIERDICECNNCHLKFIARDGQTPLQGRFGTSMITLTIMLKFIVRGVLRKSAGFLGSGFGMKLAPASLQAMIERAARAGAVEYAALNQKIRAAKLLYIDETSFRVLGKNRWVWVFRSDTDILLVIRNNRGSGVLKEILGMDYAGIVVCDCWRAYDFLLQNAKIQRCWAHLLRRSNELDSVAGRRFHRKLSKLFDGIQKFNCKERTGKQRLRKYEQLTTMLKKEVAHYGRNDDCSGVAKYIDFHIESWFTCVRFAGVQPTNNYAEQAIREPVIVRKIIGAFRSERGTRTYETLASLIATWQFRKLDIKTELHRMLSANLC